MGRDAPVGPPRGALVPTGIAEMAMVLRPGTVVRASGMRGTILGRLGIDTGWWG
jgi:hypothetical protein